MSRSFVEAPSSGLLNEIEGTPFALEDGLPEQLGPNPTTGDGFGPVVPNRRLQRVTRPTRCSQLKATERAQAAPERFCR